MFDRRIISDTITNQRALSKGNKKPSYFMFKCKFTPSLTVVIHHRFNEILIHTLSFIHFECILSAEFISKMLFMRFSIQAENIMLAWVWKEDFLIHAMRSKEKARRGSI